MIKLINNEAFINYAFNQLSKDPVMESLINSLGHKINPTERYNRNYALAICNLIIEQQISFKAAITCLLYTSPSPRDLWISRMPSSA